MKPVPLKTQKVLTYIPVINCLNLFIWSYNSRLFNLTRKERFIGDLIAVGYMIPIILIAAFLDNLFPMFEDIIGYAFLYLSPLAMGRALIEYQSHYFK